MAATATAVQFYDTQAERKLKDFVHFNKRVERGWETVSEWAGSPSRILEVGCGVGSICWRMAQRFPDSEVVGIDYSPGNLAIANRVFQRPNVKFVLTSGTDGFSLGQFDLIVLMDVYEHVNWGSRPTLHANLRRSLSESGAVILTIPTPRHLAWLRKNNPKEIQPVDEDITPEVLCALARDLERDLLAYREVDIWQRGDYAHALIGTSRFPGAMPAPSRFNLCMKSMMEKRMREKLVRKAGLKVPPQ